MKSFRCIFCFTLIFCFICGFNFILADDYTAYLSIEGIEGTATNPEYRGWIEVSDLNYKIGDVPEASLLARLDVLPDGRILSYAGEECKNQFFQATKEIDQCSPKLADFFKSGHIFPSVKLALLSPSGKELALFEVGNAVISSMNDDNKQNVISFGFEKIDVKIHPKE